MDLANRRVDLVNKTTDLANRTMGLVNRQADLVNRTIDSGRGKGLETDHVIQYVVIRSAILGLVSRPLVSSTLLLVVTEAQAHNSHALSLAVRVAQGRGLYLCEERRRKVLPTIFLAQIHK